MIENAGAAMNLHKFSRDEISLFNTINLIIELFFLLEIILSFITSYVYENNKMITNFAKIRTKYIHNGFLWDLICIAPFYPIFKFKGSRLFFLIKCLRLNEAFEILDVKVFYNELLRLNKKQLEYGVALECEYPIASGVIEGACRHLINDRLDITGARWSLDGAEAILRLRSLKSSGDLQDYWSFHKQQAKQRLYG